MAEVTIEGRTIVVLSSERSAGKTLASCAMLLRIRALGHRSIGIVPIETACTYGDNHDLLARDGEQLRASSSGPVPPLVTSPYRFAADASPADAASASGLELELSDLTDAIEAAASFGTIVVVEGPHHATVDVASDGQTVDLAVRLGAPVLAVGRTDDALEEVARVCAERGVSIGARVLVTSDVLDDLKAQLEQDRVAETLIEALRPA